MEPLVTAEALREWSGLDLPAAKAQMLVESASGQVRSYCGWHIAPLITGDQLVLDGKGGTLLGLPTLRVVAVGQVEQGQPAVLVDPAVYRWSQAGYLIRRTGCWSGLLRDITATIDHGYPDTPPEIRAVVLDLATRHATPIGVVREQTGPFSVQYAPNACDLGDHDKAILDRYAIPGSP